MLTFTVEIRIGTDVVVMIIRENVNISLEGLSKTHLASNMWFSEQAFVFRGNHQFYDGKTMKGSFYDIRRFHDFHLRRPLISCVLRA